MGDYGKRAEQLFMEGYNCSQAVLLSYSDITGLDDKTAAMLASGFGGGMGRMREVCGAVSGMFIVLGIVAGYSDPSDALASRFRKENGSIICKELLGLSKPEKTYIPAERTNEYYKKRPCPKIVCMAADILEEYLDEHGYLTGKGI